MHPLVNYTSEACFNEHKKTCEKVLQNTSKTCIVITSKDCTLYTSVTCYGGDFVVRKALIDYRGNRTQLAMAKIYNVTQQAWQQWEKGITNPSVVIMKKLEIDSGIKMEDLFPDVFKQEELV